MPTTRGAMRTDVLMEWPLKYLSPWQQRRQQHQQQQQLGAAQAFVNTRTIY